MALSVVSTRQTPEQLVVPAAQETAHTPAEHTWPEAQARPQAPQWLRSVVRSRQMPEQLVVPAPHDTVQVPAEQS